MAYKHRVHYSEVPTAIKSPVVGESGVTVAFVAAPYATDKIVLAYNEAEAVAKLGYVPANASGKFDFTASEVIYTHFKKFSVAPVIFVNVLYAAVHKSAIADQVIPVVDGVAIIEHTGVQHATVTVTGATIETDYVLTLAANGFMQVNITEDGALASATEITVAYDYADPSKLTSADFIGGIDPNTLQNTGFELLSEIFARFGIVAGTVIAPGASKDPAVALIGTAKVKALDGVFKGVFIADIDTVANNNYQKAVEAKRLAGLSDTHLITVWPKVALSGTQVYMSSNTAALMHYVDTQNGDVPYKSPSNENAQIDSTVLEDGTPVWLNLDTAEFLNGNGIHTAINWDGAWRSWGNETSIYPQNTDVKDRFIPSRRMFNWVGNTLVRTYFSRLDFPLNLRQVETVVNSANTWLNSLVSDQYLLGGRVEFLRGENSDTSLLDGKSVFHVYLATPVPNGEIEFRLEYDVDYLQTLFAEA